MFIGVKRKLKSSKTGGYLKKGAFISDRTEYFIEQSFTLVVRILRR